MSTEDPIGQQPSDPNIWSISTHTSHQEGGHHHSRGQCRKQGRDRGLSGARRGRHGGDAVAFGGQCLTTLAELRD